ncbi:hypothetical protein PRIPAC_87446 [Pristionchus pacificus]|uniref:Uncharacterized protein n=1 Tax=Pristionchus pacificus TaxID=54126 RepID=A0A454XKU9_PRIPA|nr:hypothetical protein PRIPAC_87446 [Pristionchus pacificus]|eukprot:PDM60499.1 hypothetical protein PRIPAC_53477 [Pristionchus pacificus]
MFRRQKEEEKKISWRSNPFDAALMHRTWTEDFETLYLIGSTIFHNLFGGPNGKTCKSLFPWIAMYEDAGKDYVETNDFRTVAIFLDEMSEKAKVEIFLYKLGQRHEAVHDGFNGRMQALTLMGELTVEERDRAVRLWTDTVVYIFDLVQEGFFDGLKGFDRFPGVEKWALVQYAVPSPQFHPTLPENHY